MIVGNIHETHEEDLNKNKESDGETHVNIFDGTNRVTNRRKHGDSEPDFEDNGEEIYQQDEEQPVVDVDPQGGKGEDSCQEKRCEENTKVEPRDSINL